MENLPRHEHERVDRTKFCNKNMSKNSRVSMVVHFITEGRIINDRKKYKVQTVGWVF